jgi:hypothetical protein
VGVKILGKQCFGVEFRGLGMACQQKEVCQQGQGESFHAGINFKVENYWFIGNIMVSVNRNADDADREDGGRFWGCPAAEPTYPCVAATFR